MTPMHRNDEITVRLMNDITKRFRFDGLKMQPVTNMNKSAATHPTTAEQTNI